MDELERNQAVEKLFYMLCVDLGFCLPPEEERQLKESPPSDADSFAKAVFKAEGMEPEDQLSLFRQVRTIINDHLRRISD